MAYATNSKKAKLKRAMLGRLNYKMGEEGDGKDVSHQKDGSVTVSYTHLTLPTTPYV